MLILVECFKISINHLSLQIILTNFTPLVSFYNPRKHKKNRSFLMFSRGVERNQWREMGWVKVHHTSYDIFTATHEYVVITHTAQKMKVSTKDFFSKCNQTRSFLWTWSHLLKKFLMENFIFCALSIKLWHLSKLIYTQALS